MTFHPIIKKLGLGLAMTSAVAFTGIATAQAADPANGESVFRRCAACHKVGEGARNGVGPALNGIMNRPVASVPDYDYGTGIIEAKEQGLIWTEETLSGYLEDPRKYLQEVTGNNRARAKMVFRLRKEDERADVIAYLATFAEDGSRIEPGAEPAEADAEATTN